MVKSIRRRGRGNHAVDSWWPFTRIVSPEYHGISLSTTGKQSNRYPSINIRRLGNKSNSKSKSLLHRSRRRRRRVSV